MGRPKRIYHLTWLTDLGPLQALATDKGLAAVNLVPKDPDQVARRLAGSADYELIEGGSPLLETARRQVDEYLAGQRRDFDLEMDLTGTEFQLRVWTALARIPFGRLTTYGRLAAEIGRPRAARAVGGAVGANPIPIVIPCHRVVSTTGLGGFGGGLARKVALLGLEGVTEADLARIREEEWG